MAPRARARVLAPVLACLAAVAGWLHAGSYAARAAHAARSTGTRPNVVLIITDDQRFDTLWAMPRVRRRLVGHGVKFTNIYVVNSLCCPSRASILTGRYSHSTGVYSNHGPHGGFEAFKDRSTIATWLHADGYRTALVGKYLNGYGGTYVPPGWDRFVGLQMYPRSPTGGYYYDYTLDIDGSLRKFGHSASDYSTNVFADKAVRFIAGTKRGPLFLYFAPWAPHGPPIPAPRDADRFPNLPPARPPNFNEQDVSDKPHWVQDLPVFDAQRIHAVDEYRRGQLQTLLAVDRAVGRIIDALRASGRLHNTLLMFTSDNGLAWGEHRWTNKQVAYEESVRVPLVMRYGPGTPDAGSVANIALNIDLASTIAAAAGTSAPGAEGRSLLPIVKGRPGPSRSAFLIEHLQLWPGAPPPTFCAVHTHRYVYVVYVTGEKELYDLESDPYELQNRAGDPAMASVEARVASRLHDLCHPPPPGMTRP